MRIRKFSIKRDGPPVSSNGRFVALQISQRHPVIIKSLDKFRPQGYGLLVVIHRRMPSARIAQ